DAADELPEAAVRRARDRDQQAESAERVEEEFFRAGLRRSHQDHADAEQAGARPKNGPRAEAEAKLGGFYGVFVERHRRRQRRCERNAHTHSAPATTNATQETATGTAYGPICTGHSLIARTS